MLTGVKRVRLRGAKHLDYRIPNAIGAVEIFKDRMHATRDWDACIMIPEIVHPRMRHNMNAVATDVVIQAKPAERRVGLRVTSGQGKENSLVGSAVQLSDTMVDRCSKIGTRYKKGIAGHCAKFC